jgi:5-formyltetrahydrofolate cyclo-ligase
LASARLLEHLQPHAGKPVAGYMAMRTEINPITAMAELSLECQIGVPVIVGAGRPLVFHRWSPGAEMVDGTFGARVPAKAEPMVPEVLIVPLVAFDRHGGRLGYGGGFYDRTLQLLRGNRRTYAIGMAYAAQESDALPLEPTDQPLDAVVTEAETLVFG